MLIDFSVANFRSFASQQQLSLNAGRFRSERVGAVLDTLSKTTPHLLRVAAILGANGAGKSSFVAAIDFLQSFVARSAQSTQMGDRIKVTPFKLDRTLSAMPSSFEIGFLHEGVEYKYAVSLNSTRVVHECLFSQSSNQPLRQVFLRQWENEKEVWSLGTLPKEQAKLWQQSTRPNALFLSTAVQLNSDMLAKPFEWITDKLKVQSTTSSFSAALTSHLIKEHVEDGCREEILNLLREADLGIRNVLIEEQDFDADELPSDVPEELRKRLIEEFKDKKFLLAKFEHRGRPGSYTVLDYDDESDGTQRLYEMAGPLITSLRHDYTLVIDEIETSLHPLLVRLIIDKFQRPEREGGQAQIIFSSHSDSLLDSNILERDQFWFVEKRRGQSELIPLQEYKPRKGEALRINYLRGKYGGIPSIAQVER